MHIQLLSDQYLRSIWDRDYQAYVATDDQRVLQLLRAWAGRAELKEASSEAALLQRFFVDLWGYSFAGETASRDFTIYPQYAVGRAGQTGGTGAADVALGHWNNNGAGIPQVLGEFKDVRSGLDVEQQRKGNTRSPVKQAADYLKEARAAVWPSDPVQPVWAVVTDMNEFRLYHYRSIPHEYQRFVISPVKSDETVSLLAENEDGRFQRFLFTRVFAQQWLLARKGKSELERILDRQWVHEKELENSFYKEYRAYREELYQTIKEANPDFSGTAGQLVRLTQRLLDRLIFLLYAEDIGERLGVEANFLRDLLVEKASSQFFAPDGSDVWETIKYLFEVLNHGGKLGNASFFQFNGGLFAELAQLESLTIPNRVFCSPSQVGDREAVLTNRKTLLYLSASYAFGDSPTTSGQSLSLYALGRIFEQSITELEILEAEAEGRTSINKLSKRKRDGVYYTPEWVTSYIVENTVGTKLDEFRRQGGYETPPAFSQDEIDAYQVSTSSDRRYKKPKAVEAYLAFLDEYEHYLSSLKIVDPACGSGAFLIQAFDRIYNEYRWINSERQRVSKQAPLSTVDTHIKAILSNNLYGVDINPESVEITKLALWLHTVRPNTPLSDLDNNIRCGNSIVSRDFYYNPDGKEPKQDRLAFQHDFAQFDETTRERINAFDWDLEFQEITAQGGFDCVISNPPYVKLQHFRKAESAMAKYLLDAKEMDGTPHYLSTQTKNFDLYLPFIERGISLLNEDGLMGYIAPNVWLKNEYGEGLRRLVVENGSLDRWVDFGSFQVFEEATTYTALQFYAGKPRNQVRFFAARDGDVSNIDWDARSDSIPYAELPRDGSPLYLVTNEERELMRRMEASGPRLDDPKWTKNIIVGLQTSADDIYHLKKVGPGKYESKPKGGEPSIVEIEDELMRPLVSGSDVRRYAVPQTETHILFPYRVTGASRSTLIAASVIRNTFPNGTQYLKMHESRLRARENGKMDHDAWYGYVYRKNLDKQETSKILVPRLSKRLRAAFDANGEFYLDNVDVNGVIPSSEVTGWYLSAILNSSTANAYWLMISKPFESDYFSANKQFIAPIPIPNAPKGRSESVVRLAQELQELHTGWHREQETIDHRLGSRAVSRFKRPLSWISGSEERDEQEALREQMGRILTPDVELTVQVSDGELILLADGAPLLDQVFIEKNESEWLLAQWRRKARNVTKKVRSSPEKLLDEFRTLSRTDNQALKAQIVDADRTLRALEAEIEEKETEIDETVMDLYGLDEDQKRLVRSRRS